MIIFIYIFEMRKNEKVSSCCVKDGERQAGDSVVIKGQHKESLWGWNYSAS